MRSINDYKDHLIKTPFDEPEYDISIPDGAGGVELQQILIRISQIHGNISTLYAYYSKLYEEQEDKCDEIKDMATVQVKNDIEYSKFNLEEKKSLAKILSVNDGDNKTKFYEEMKHLHLLGYYVSRGKEKLNELRSNGDICRSLLSWNKEEMKNFGG